MLKSQAFSLLSAYEELKLAYTITANSPNLRFIKCLWGIETILLSVFLLMTFWSLLSAYEELKQYANAVYVNTDGYVY